MGISETEAQTTFGYLASQNRPPGTPEPAAKMAVARALVDQRCGSMPQLWTAYTRRYSRRRSGVSTVARMAEYAAGSAGALQPGEEAADYRVPLAPNARWGEPKAQGPGAEAALAFAHSPDFSE